MSKNVIVITVDGNQYKVEKNGISDFALIGVLECILTDLKAVNRQHQISPVQEPPVVKLEENNPSEELEKVENSPTELEEKIEVIDSEKQEDETAATTELKNRIIKARQAIRSLKGEVEEIDLDTMTYEELQ